MKSILTIILNTFARIGAAVQRVTLGAVAGVLKTILVCVIAAAMWIPLCITAETAVAENTAKSSIHSAIKQSATKHAATNRSETSPAPVSGGSLMQPAPLPVFVNGDDSEFAKFRNGGGVYR